MNKKATNKLQTSLEQQRAEIRRRLVKFVCTGLGHLGAFNVQFDWFEFCYETSDGPISVVLTLEEGDNDIFLSGKAILPLEVNPSSWRALTEFSECIEDRVAVGKFWVWEGDGVEYIHDLVIPLDQAEIVASRLLAGLLVTVRWMLPRFRCVALGWEGVEDVLAKFDSHLMKEQGIHTLN